MNERGGFQQPEGDEVLVLDDVEADARSLVALLARELKETKISFCTSMADVFVRLRSHRIGVLVTDLFMPNNSGVLVPLGDKVVMEIKTFYPQVEVVVVTGSDELEQAVRSMRLGASHFLVKSARNLEKLPAIVRELLDLRPSLRSPGFHCDNLIGSYWKVLISEAQPQERGYLLECLTKLLLDTCEGIRGATMRRRNKIEEFDIVAENEGKDHLWRQFGPVLLVECKCLDKRVERKELDIFLAKLGRRYEMANLGIFVSWSGFTEGFEEVVRSQVEQTIVTFDREQLWKWSVSRDRGAFLRASIQDRLLS